jgi:hypothetical protein
MEVEKRQKDGPLGNSPGAPLQRISPTNSAKKAGFIEFFHKDFPSDFRCHTCMTKAKKTRMVSIRLTEAQWQYLEGINSRLERERHLRLTRTSIVLKMLELGMPALEQKFFGPPSVNRGGDEEDSVA